MAVPGAGGAGAFAQKFAAMRSAKEMFKDCMRWVTPAVPCAFPMSEDIRCDVCVVILLIIRVTMQDV